MIHLIRLGARTDNPPLFVIPGLDGTIGSVEPVARQLAGSREVIVADYSLETNKTLELLVSEIATTIKSDDKKQIDLLGQSIGTIVAAQLATSHGLPVRKVVLTCTFTRLNWNILKNVVTLSRMTPRWLYRLTSPALIALSCGPVGDGWKHPAFDATRNSDPAASIKRTEWEINRDFSSDLSKVQLPLLILMGEQDRFVPNIAEEVKKLQAMFATQAARVDIIPGAGHIFFPTAAVALASEKIEAFLGEG